MDWETSIGTVIPWAAGHRTWANRNHRVHDCVEGRPTTEGCCRRRESPWTRCSSGCRCWVAIRPAEEFRRFLARRWPTYSWTLLTETCTSNPCRLLRRTAGHSTFTEISRMQDLIIRSVFDADNRHCSRYR